MVQNLDPEPSLKPFRLTMRNDLDKVKNKNAKVAHGLRLLGKEIEDNVLAYHRPEKSRSPSKDNAYDYQSCSFYANGSLLSKTNSIGLDKKFVARMNRRLRDEKLVYPKEVLRDEYL